MSTIRYYVDRIRVKRHQVVYHVRTCQVRVHYAVHGAVEVIAGAARQSLWAQEGWVLLGLATFGGVSRDNHVARDLAPQRILCLRQHIPLRCQRNNHTMS